MCLSPVILAGYLLTMQTSWHHTTTFDAPVLEVQTCEVGVALNARVAASGLSGLGVQYGFRAKRGNWSVALQPLAGISHADHHVYELPSQTQFELGFGLMAGWHQWRLAVSYWHLSNAGLAQPNIGLDLIAVQTGWSFQ